jgi:hypothetical protein
MGVNQQTSVPAFTVGQVLTAQQQTEINTGVPVFADTTARDAAFGSSGRKGFGRRPIVLSRRYKQGSVLRRQ